jgi:hypothetical protein
MIRPILLLEINEVSWRLLDRYPGQGYDALDRFFANSRTLTNVAVDDDFEYLWPWVTWPTFHRGVPFEGHRIKHLGQDISTYGGTRYGRSSVSVVIRLASSARCIAGPRLILARTGSMCQIRSPTMNPAFRHP